MDFTLNLLKELTETAGVSGYETPIRSVIKRYLGGYGELSQDKIGSVICRSQGSVDKPRVMLAGHMDEIGFMVKQITPEGFIKFLPLGGWFDQVLLGQRVVIKSNKGEVVGVLGAKPPHLLAPDERDKVVKRKEMYIDIGAASKDEVDAAGIQLGDPVIPRADFVELANGKTYLSKAFDDRVGTALIISALQELKVKDHPNTLYGVATVMEEIGSRGATTSVRAIDPDVAIVLESDIAGDVPGIKPEDSSTRLGQGPSLLLHDARLIPNIHFRDLVLETAKQIGVSIQLSALEVGATDGGPIHLHGIGVPTIVLAVPVRHIHSHSSIIHRDDYDQAVKLLVALIERLDAATVATLTE